MTSFRDYSRSGVAVGKTGRAVLWNAVVLAVGFLVLTPFAVTLFF